MAASRMGPGTLHCGDGAAQDVERPGHILPQASTHTYAYDPAMPNLTIYVDRVLAEKVRRYGVPPSVTCQRALARQVRIAERRAGNGEAIRHAASRAHPRGRDTGSPTS